MQEIKVEYVSIDKIKPYQRNARKHDSKSIEVIANSISEFGMADPIAVWGKENIVIEGHGRLLALKQLGYDKAPIIHLDYLTDEQRRAYTLAHNKTAEFSEWDMELLTDEAESIFNIDLSDFGFDLTEEEEEETEIIEDEVPEEVNPVAKIGDIWQLGRHRLMCGDSTSIDDIKKLMNENKIDMIYTDPPYGMGLNTDYSSLNWGDRKGKKYEQGIVDDFNPEMINTILSLNVDETFLWGADYFSEYLINKNDGSWIVWDKTLESNGDAGSNSEFELCWSRSKHKREVIHYNWFRYFGLSQQDIKTRIHPTQKPIQVITPILDKYSNEENNILDLFGGSGSTLIACEQLNRKCFMMELDPHYVDVIIARWEQFTGQKAVLLNG